LFYENCQSYFSNICFVFFLFTRCSSDEAVNKKDLDENMPDLVMYHDNLGTYLRSGDADYSTWLLEGMDSTLKVIALKFDEHRKLDRPFEKSYKKLLVPSIGDIRKALQQNNFPAAVVAYRVLTLKCNDCHSNNDIDKEVFDWSDGTMH
jgi:hypothetical protein